MSEGSDFSWWIFLLKSVVILVLLGWVKKIYWEFMIGSKVRAITESDFPGSPVDVSRQGDIEIRFNALVKDFEKKALNYYVYVVASREGSLGQLDNQLEQKYPREFSRPFIDYKSEFTLDETSAFMPLLRRRLEILPVTAKASSDERSRFEQCLLEQAEHEAERIVQEYAKY